MLVSSPSSKSNCATAESPAPFAQPASSSDRLTWEPGEPVPPRSCLPIKVQIAARVLHVAGINNTDESFTARISLHMSWVDRYYQLPPAEREGFFVQHGQVVSREQVVHYASYPRVGRRAVCFPDEDIGQHGVLVP